MLACAAARDASSSAALARLVSRLAASLGIFGNPVSTGSFASAHFCKAPCTHTGAISSKPLSLALRPSASGAYAVVTGEIDNLAELVLELGVPDAVADAVYATAWDRWGDELDLHLIGDYAAVLVRPDGALRLARSPWRAPPLHYCRLEGVDIVATTPRVLLAAGLPNRLDERKLVDNLLLHLTEEDGWYPGSFRVDLGCSVTLMPDGSRSVRRFYDHFAQRTTRLSSPEAYVEAGDELLREACGKMLANARQPGIFLSGGLDSSNVAARALQCLPEGIRLKSFTFRPHPDFEEPPETQRYFGDDWPAVEAFARMHPQLEPFAARSIEFDDDWDKLFLAMGQAPAGITNMALYPPICRMARDEGCDLMLDAHFGNVTFSDTGQWAYPQFLKHGNWAEMFKAIRSESANLLDVPIQFARMALGPYLPDFVWRAWRRLHGRSVRPPQLDMTTARADALDRYDTVSRARATGFLRSRWWPANREEQQLFSFGRGEMQSGDGNHAFEQVYGFRWRDVTAYRLFMEFCLGLPPDILVRDGQDRWLARQLGKGHLPEWQRTRRRFGMHNCDWHVKLTPQLDSLKDELAEISQDPVLSRVIDIDKLERIYASWPDRFEIDDSTILTHGMGLSHAILTKRYVDFVTGRNR